jgi:hypothetical protein
MPVSLSWVVRPIAQRRAGLLGWIAALDCGIDSLLFASGCPVPQVRVRSLHANLGTEWIRADRVDIGTFRPQVNAQQPGVNLGHRVDSC